MFKKILSTILVLSMILALCASLFSCNNKDKGNDNVTEQENQGNNDTTTPEKVNYTVTVVDEEGTPIKGVGITFTPKSGTAVPFPTDADGKSSYKTDKEITVTVTSIPEGYAYDKLNVAQKFDGNSMTITLTILAPYVIRVVDQDGNPVAGVQVQMCDEGGSCRIPVRTDVNGQAEYPFEDGVFHAQLTSVPEGYSVEDEGAYYNFVDGVATITLTKN